MKEFRLLPGDMCVADFAYTSGARSEGLYLYAMSNPHQKLFPPVTDHDIMLMLGRIEDESFIDYIVVHPKIGIGRLNVHLVKKL